MSGQEEGPVSLSDAPTRRLNMIEAINDALDVMMGHDPDCRSWISKYGETGASDDGGGRRRGGREARRRAVEAAAEA